MKTKQQLGRSLILSGIATTIFTVSISGASRARQQEPTTATQTDKVEHEMVTRQAVCRWVDRPPVIDGKLDDPVLAAGQGHRRFRRLLEQGRPGSKTQALAGLG